MSGNAGINLATVGTAELEAMSVQVFTSALETMSGDAIARFRRMRKLSTHHRQALEKYLVKHPEKAPEGEAPAAKPAEPAPGKPKAAKAPKTAKAAKASEKPADAAHRSPLPDFKQRLRAWWEGVDVKDLPLLDAARGKGKPEEGPAAGGTSDKSATPKSPAPQPDEAAPAPTPATAPRSVIPGAERLDVIQKIWGKGFNLPGGQDFLPNLIKTINLPADRPCLDIAPGLGGSMRAVASARDVKVEGIERDPLFAMVGGMISEELGMTETAPIRSGIPETEELRQGYYGAVFAREALYCCADRKGLLSRIAGALADGGSLVLTDFILTDHMHKDETLKAWLAAEPRKPFPATRQDYSELLRELRYEVKTCDDMTAQYIPLIQAGWNQLHSCLQSAKLPPETATMLIDEGDLWLARSRAMESGGLKLLHIHALMHRAPKRALNDSMKIE